MKRQHWATRLRKTLMFDLWGGKKYFKARVPVNLQKGGTLLFCIVLMYTFNDFSQNNMIYSAMHGNGLRRRLRLYLDPEGCVLSRRDLS